MVPVYRAVDGAIQWQRCQNSYWQRCQNPLQKMAALPTNELAWQTRSLSGDRLCRNAVRAGQNGQPLKPRRLHPAHLAGWIF